VSEPENRFTDPILWLVLLGFCLFLYVFAYPVILALIGPSLYEFQIVSKIIRTSALPLSWLNENLPAYQAYIDFLETHVARY